jgi:hypothetical protein
MTFDEWLQTVYRRPGEPKLNALARASTEGDISMNTLRKVLARVRVSERVAVKIFRLTRGQVQAGSLS